ncbi:MAG TPA: histidine phosphatase family protein [Bryobacteraceae bacterium]|nr:histidine phosphatase family protein [Bryobacteraceae bacterium]
MRVRSAIVSFAALALAPTAPAQTLSGDALVKALRQGGYVIVMRHASSPRQEPDKKTANPDNLTFERQLDQTGRETAAAMGRALRELKIPLGEVLSSPTYRALETVRLAQFGKAQTFPELGDGGQNMRAATDSQSDFLRKRVKLFAAGTNTLIVTHFPNITAAFPQLAAGLADGEALIFGPDGKGGAMLVARVKIEDWPKMRP